MSRLCHKIYWANRVPLSRSATKTMVNLCLAGILSGLFFLFPGLVEESLADPQNIDIRTLVTLQTGEVNTNQGQELVIDHKRYMVSSSATIMDDEGRLRDLKEIIPGAQVRFRLRNERIDYIVIMLPR